MAAPVSFTPAALLAKYDMPSPRYTSYPTVPYWNEAPLTQERWLLHVQQAFRKISSSNGISLYLYLPFCEKLCPIAAATNASQKTTRWRSPI